jgi:spore coat protein U-like protein
MLVGAMSASVMTLPPPAAAETGKTLQVSATIQPGCLVAGLGASGNAGTIGQLDFGQATSLSTGTRTASLATSQAISLRCTPGVALKMTVDGGGHVDGGTRNLQRGGNPANRIAYTLCEDAECQRPIAVSQQIGIAVTTENYANVSLPIHGRLTLPGALPPGAYSDALTVTLSW